MRPPDFGDRRVGPSRKPNASATAAPASDGAENHGHRFRRTRRRIVMHVGIRGFFRMRISFASAGGVGATSIQAAGNPLFLRISKRWPLLFSGSSLTIGFKNKKIQKEDGGLSTSSPEGRVIPAGCSRGCWVRAMALATYEEWGFGWRLRHLPGAPADPTMAAAQLCPVPVIGRRPVGGADTGLVRRMVPVAQEMYAISSARDQKPN